MKKKLGGFNNSFLRNFVGRGHSFFNFFKGGLLKKSFRKVDLNTYLSIF